MVRSKAVAEMGLRGELRMAEDRAAVVDATGEPRCDESKGRAWTIRLTWAKYLLSIPAGYNKGPSRVRSLEHGVHERRGRSPVTVPEDMLQWDDGRSNGVNHRRDKERDEEKSSGTAATAVEATRRAEAGRLCVRDYKRSSAGRLSNEEAFQGDDRNLE